MKLFASAKIGEKTIRREVRPYTRVWSEANIATSRPTRELALAVRDSAPYALTFVPERVEIKAGKKMEVKLKLNRRWPDFKNKVNVQPSSFPGSIRLTTLEIAEGKDEVTLTLDAQAGARPGDYTLTVLGQAQVPFSKDGKTAKAPTLVTLPARPLMLTVLPKK